MLPRQGSQVTKIPGRGLERLYRGALNGTKERGGGAKNLLRVQQ